MKTKPIKVCTDFAKKSETQEEYIQIPPKKSKQFIQRIYDIPLKIDNLQAAPWDNFLNLSFSINPFSLNLFETMY